MLTSSDNQEPNFQKAGTTLDASVKIYGYRVDDTLHTGYRILDNLNRGEQSKQPSEASKPRHKAGNGAEGSGKAVSTIETNLQNIEMDPSDFQFNADPLFHLMSRQFDEGGVKGLLLSNLVSLRDLFYLECGSGVYRCFRLQSTRWNQRNARPWTRIVRFFL